MSCVNRLRVGFASLAAALLLGACATGGTGGGSSPSSARASSPEAQLHNQAVAAVQAGDPATAEALFLQLTQEHPRYATPWLNLALLLHKRGAHADSATVLAEAIKRDSGLAPAWNLQGVLAREANDVDAAEAAYRQALNADGSYAPAWLNLGILLEIWRGQLDGALRAYQKYQELSPAESVDPRVAGWIADLQRRLDRGA